MDKWGNSHGAEPKQPTYEGQNPNAVRNAQLREQARTAAQGATIEGKSTADQRFEMYADVRAMLTPGFLTDSLAVNGIQIALRTFNRADYFLLRHRSGVTLEDTKIVDWVIAASIWLLDGQPLLEDPETVHRIYQVCRTWPVTIKNEIMGILDQLRKRVDEAVEMGESFFYEDESRVMWRAYGARVNHEYGLPGSERLGLNAIQEMWIAYNDIEDERESFMQDWTAAKLVAMAMSPKAIKKLNSSDESSSRQLKAERQAKKDQTYFNWIGRSDLAAKATPGRSGEFSDVQMALTVEELQDDYRRWRAGVKDEHDRVVDGYKSAIRQKIEGERQAQQDRMAEVEAMLAAEGLEDQPLGSLFNIEKLRPAVQRHAARVHTQGKGGRLYDKYVKNPSIPGHIAMRQGRPVATPNDPETLMDKIAARKPVVE